VVKQLYCVPAAGCGNVGAPMSKGDLENAVVPEGEGPLSDAVTVRLPKKMLERIERAAKETENNRSDTILHLLRWALAAYEGKTKGKKP
jgi:hypothetical protein